MTRLTCTVLGCGTSSGVPSLGMGWGLCDPENPKNRRMRCSLLLQWSEGQANEQGGGISRRISDRVSRSILIDSSPDCREQLWRAKVKSLDAVLYTHDHADHCHGIDDLKWMRGKEAIPTYASKQTLRSLTLRFGYMFDSFVRPPSSLYRAVLSERAVHAWQIFTPVSEGASLLPMALDHGQGLEHGTAGDEVFGFRCGDIAYTTDCVSLSERAFECLEGVRIWIVGCLRREQHPTHAHLSRVVEWAERVRAERVFLTHMNGSMDYETLCKELPPHIRPAYDFLRIFAEF